MPLRDWLLGLLLPLAVPAVSAEPLHHRLDVRLDPASHRLQVQDVIRFPEGAPDNVVFQLHAGLSPSLAGPGTRLSRLEDPTSSQSELPVETYRASLGPGVRQLTLTYSGEIHHPVSESGQEYARSFSVSPGLIGPEGVFLGGASHWGSPIFQTCPSWASR